MDSGKGGLGVLPGNIFEYRSMIDSEGEKYGS